MRHLMNALDLTVDEIHDLIVLAEKNHSGSGTIFRSV